ncbi:MAG: UDP-glucose/GDP-mannose dehydrogenase family protein [Pseudomonadota bacterium]
MRVSVFGIGYVGAVTAACLCKSGHEVIAVDNNAAKVDLLNAGKAPIVEPGLPELISGAVARGALRATTNVADAIANTELSIVCVGTPSLPNGNLDLNYVVTVCEEIGAALAKKDMFHSVVMRSTMLPGSMAGTVIPSLSRSSGMEAGKDFGVAIYPEFLRESTAIADYLEPEVIVIGKMDDLTVERLRELNEGIVGEVRVVEVGTAEAIKYANNCWHATKIVFANEMGNICKAADVDGHEVMEVLCSDKRLNISPAYMKPGMAFGGSCLPKDLRALRYKAASMDVRVPMLEAVQQSNELQVDRAFDLIASRATSRRIGMLGLSFKSETDDLRESPLVSVAEKLYGKGYDLKIFDANVSYSKLVGANLHFIRSHIPHLAELLVEDVEEVVSHGDTIVIGNGDQRFRALPGNIPTGKTVVDLVRIDRTLRTKSNYEGLSW